MDTSAYPVPRMLASLPLFHDLAPDELNRIAQGCQIREFGRGDMVFRVGQPCEEFHAVISGQVKLFAISPDGHEKVIELVSPGNCFAEAVMFLGRPYIVNAQALAATLLLTVGKRVMLAEIAREPRLALQMLAGISRRMHRLISDIESCSLQNGVQRVIGYLLREAPDAGNPGPLLVALQVSKATIASRLSMTPEYFSKVLHELAEAGLIEVDRRNIRIPDADRLSKFGLQQWQGR